MNILLDTHIILWYLNGDSKLPEKAKSYIDDWENNLYFSVASLWEIKIKHIIHPNKMMNSASEILDLCRSADFTLLPLLPEHIKLLHTLQREEKRPLCAYQGKGTFKICNYGNGKSF